MVFIVEAFFSGCISKVVNDSKDYSWDKIKRAINDKNNCNLSTKIYRVIERALNMVTDKKIKDADKLYDAIEKIFIEFQNHSDTLESVKCGLGLLCSDVSDQRCENFLEKFYEGICQDDDLYKEIIIYLQKKGVKISQEEFQKINEKIDTLTEIISNSNDNDDKVDLPDRESIKSRTQEYTDKWNDNMFLNSYNKRDENSGVSVKLREIYKETNLPHYIWNKNIQPSKDLKNLIEEYIYIKENDRSKMLLIIGKPGIGKSTLLTWIAANFFNKRKDILIYRFASDLKNINWHADNVLDEMLKELKLSLPNLNGKMLIIDGFDEISIGNDREYILNRIYWELQLKNSQFAFSLIITCRENYIKHLHKIYCDHIKLLNWEDQQIREFCSSYQKITKIEVSQNTMENILKNREILGVPLILYMVLALNISIEEESSIVDVYDKIFSLDGGIYDRCIDRIHYAEPHRISEIKKQIHQISREIAIWMFENNPNEAIISRKEYRKIYDRVARDNKNTNITQDILIGSYFNLCEGTDTEEINFGHRSIYEYFVAETIITSIYKMLDVSIEKLARVLGRLLKQGSLQANVNILNFLKQKIDNSELKNKYKFVYETFRLMIQDGMIYHTGKSYKNVITCEMNVFANMLELLHLWDEGYCMSFDDSSCYYLTYNKCFDLNLKGITFRLGKDKTKNEKLDLSKGVYLEGVYLVAADLSDADLSGAYLRNSDLRQAIMPKIKLRLADLSGANLNGVDLSGADLTRANLIEAKLVKANLQDADLTEACLTGTLLIDADLTGVKLNNASLKSAIISENQVNFLRKMGYNLQGARVFIEKTGEIILYEKSKYNKNEI